MESVLKRLTSTREALRCALAVLTDFANLLNIDQEQTLLQADYCERVEVARQAISHEPDAMSRVLLRDMVVGGQGSTMEDQQSFNGGFSTTDGMVLLVSSDASLLLDALGGIRTPRTGVILVPPCATIKSVPAVPATHGERTVLEALRAGSVTDLMDEETIWALCQALGMNPIIFSHHG